MLIYGENQPISEWVSLGLFGRHDQLDGSKAIGISKGENLIAGVVYNNFMTDQEDKVYCCELSIYSVDKTWCTRHNLKALFAFPFIQLGLKRVQTICSTREGKTIMFNKRLGFKEEGIHREFWPMGGDAISFGMLKSDCKWV